MKNGRIICKLLLFTAVLALLLGMTAIAAADGCDVHGSQGFTYDVTKQPTCTEKGSRDKYCVACGQKIGTEEIDVIGHKWKDSEKVIVAPTCTTEGTTEKEKYCTTCGIHHETEGFVITHPAALGHDWGDWVTIKAPTCETGGTEKRTCKRGCGTTEERTVNALGHLWGTPVTKAATCIAAATTTKICQRDSSHKEVTTSGSPDLQNGHVWGDWKVTTKPTCTTKGQETRICKLDSSHKEYRDIDIDPNAHVWDNGVITKQPTFQEEGEKLYTCTLNSNHIKRVKLDTVPQPNNTVCAFGPRLRDTNLYPYNTDAWYMFTPFDASAEGTQTFELVASNAYIVGTVSLTIRDGNLKIDYTLADKNKFDITLEFFTVLHRINDLTQYEPEQLLDMRIGKGDTINLEEKFGDDTSLVLYFCSRCNYRYSAKYSILNYDSAAHQRLLSNMLFLMD